jgi:hypothetical protein
MNKEPSEFVRRWNDYVARVGLGTKFPLVRLPLPDARISAASAHFLTMAGLPSAAGFSFEQLDKGLKRIDEVYWSELDRVRLQPFLMLGDDMGGNPLCLDTANSERIVLLDHERHFVIDAFVNSGVAELAECILAYQEKVEQYQRVDENAELYEGNVPKALVEATVERLRQFDPNAVREGCYWPGALEYI